MKRILLALAGLFLSAQALATGQCFVSGVTDQYTYFVAVDATDFTTRETGLSGFTVYRSRNGAAAAAFTTPTVNETDATNMPGTYELLLDEDMTLATGNDYEEMALQISVSGMAPVTKTICIARPKVTAGETLTVSSGVGSANTTLIEGSDATDQINAAADTALSDYDPPTNTEMNARTLAAASYFDPSADTVVNVTNVAQSSVDEIQATALADLFNTDSGTTYASAVSGSVVSEIADNAGGSALSEAGIADAVWDEAMSGHTTAGTAGDSLGVDVASILADTNELQTDDIPTTLATLATASALATVDSNVDAILVDTGTTLPATLGTPTDLGGGATLADNNADMAGGTFSSSTDSQEAIRNRGDAAWTTGSGTGLTAIASGTAQSATSTTLRLASGETFADDELIGAIVQITGGSTGVGQVRCIEDYTSSTDTATVNTWTTTPTGTITYEITPGIADTCPIATASGAGDLNVTASGNIGIDWANVENATSSVTLSGTTVGTVTTNTDMRGTDSAFLAASAPTNFGDLSITASTGRVDVAAIAGTAQTANDNGADINAILADTNELQTDDTPTAIAALPTAAENRAEMDSNSTQLAAIVADTNELQTDDVPGLIATAQSDLDTLTGSDGATLATTQGNYAPATVAALATVDSNVDTLVAAKVLASGTCDSGTTTTCVDAALTEADDYWKGAAIVITSGSIAGQTSCVFDFTASSDTLTFRAMTAAVSTNTYLLVENAVCEGVVSP